MKKLILTFLSIFHSLFIFAQTQNSQTKQTLEKFDKHYNLAQYDSIFSMFSGQAKAALPLEKTKDFFVQLKNRYGLIKARTFQEYQSVYGVYKTEFERGTLILSIALDKEYAIGGLFAKPYEPDTLPKITRNITKMNLPFKGEWSIFWGGDTKSVNYHVDTKFQKNAFDIIINNMDGKTFRSDGKNNEDYYAFGKEIIAPCDAEVVLAVDGVKDNIPGVMNTLYVPGNSILLKTKNNEFILLAHFKNSSIKVKQGDQIKRGQFLGLCGNSGNSSEPHIHFHLQNAEDFTKATGIKCFFDTIEVNGVLKTDYSPVKNDIVKAISSQ